jgi:cytochrome c oxidase cbb3-type subunit I/II
MSADNPQTPYSSHDVLEQKGGLFAVLSVAAILVGSLVELVPMMAVDYAPEDVAEIHPYTPLEVAGRDIYIREGCYVCHSQWVRPFRSETLRYGEWSRAGEYVWDRPFQLGSRRIGPDLHRVGGKYNDAWHFDHMKDPRSTSPGSIMPNYPWLYDASYTMDDVQASVNALSSLGHPYEADVLADVSTSVKSQADGIVKSLKESGKATEPDREIVALIAYLQRLGKDGKAAVAKAEQAGGGKP